MSLPVGHAFAGLIFYRIYQRFAHPSPLCWKMAVFFIFLAGLPDFDFFPVWFAGFPRGSTHRSLSHSLFFAVAMGFFLAWVFERWVLKQQKKHLYWLFPLTIASHPLMDLSSYDVIPPQGVELFWPIHGFVYHPQPFLLTVGVFRQLGLDVVPAWVVVLLLELCLYGGLYFIFVLLTRRQGPECSH